MRVVPVVMSYFAQTLDYFSVSHLDSQFSATIKAAGRQVDGSYDGTGVISEQHLGMKLEMFQFVNLDADIVHGAQSADGFDQLFLLQFVRGTSHDVDLDAPRRRPYQALNDHRVLITLVLQKDRLLRVIDELRNAVSAVSGAPNQMGFVISMEGLTGPVRLEALNDLINLVSM